MLTLHYQKDKEPLTTLELNRFFYICTAIGNVKK